MNGAELIAAERERQVTGEGWTAEHDDGHVNGELAMAAVCYATPERVYVKRPTGAKHMGDCFIDPWPFEDVQGPRYAGDWDRRKHLRRGNYPLWPGELTDAQRLDLLVKAGALIAAEIDRVQRISSVDNERPDVENFM